MKTRIEAISEGSSMARYVPKQLGDFRRVSAGCAGYSGEIMNRHPYYLFKPT
jgi:hypothetical protein